MVETVLVLLPFRLEANLQFEANFDVAIDLSGVVGGVALDAAADHSCFTKPHK
jgi:hypothetical protein